MLRRHHGYAHRDAEMNDHDWNLLLDRYLAGECSPAEETLIGRELVARGESLAALEALRAAHRDTPGGSRSLPATGSAAATDVAAALARLDRRLVRAGLHPEIALRRPLRLEPTTGTGRSCIRRKYGLRAAAAVALLLGGGVAAWLLARPRERIVVASAPASREFATARGQRAMFQLIDGTQVLLSVDSRLRLPAEYGASRRDVYLDGEAYFTVMHDAARPFVVHTGRGVTRDIGTKFGVRAYRNETADWVVVAEGAVAVAANAVDVHERSLKAGQLAVVSSTGAVAVADGVDIDRELAWTRGELRFANTPLDLASQRLGQWYDVDVQLADSSLAGRPVSGEYAGEPLDHVLTLITAAVGADFERHGKHVVISLKTGGPQP